MADQDKKRPTGKRKAAALRYDHGKESAPRLVGKGSGLVAEKIIALAEENGIPIHQDSDLVEILSRLDLYQEIPPETYVVAAEILAFVYRTNDKYKK